MPVTGSVQDLPAAAGSGSGLVSGGGAMEATVIGGFDGVGVRWPEL